MNEDTKSSGNLSIVRILALVIVPALIAYVTVTIWAWVGLAALGAGMVAVILLPGVIVVVLAVFVYKVLLKRYWRVLHIRHIRASRELLEAAQRGRRE